LKKFKVKASIEIHSISETLGGSGLGSSGAFTAALIKFLALYKGIKMCNQQIADLACDVEMKSLKRSSGKQDAFISVFGGFQEIIINKNGNVKIKKIHIPRDKIKKLQLSTLSYFTGISRNSESILKKQKIFFYKKKETKFIYKKITDLTEEIKKSLISGNYNKLGQNFHKHWQYKKKLSPNISNSFIDKIYSFGIKNGAIGGKIIGAGGGGFVLFIVNPKKRELLKKKFKKFKLKEFDWKFNSEGISFSKL
jgi:D-glycero-alpha-D-manno-heptose-7-phosphate kinase